MKKITKKSKSKDVAASQAIGKLKNSVASQVVAASLEKRAAPYFKKLNRIDKVTKENFGEVGVQMRALKAIRKEATEQQSTILASIKQTEKLIRGHFKPFMDQVDEKEDEIKSLIEEYLETSRKKELKAKEDFKGGSMRITTFNNKIDAATIDKVKGGASIRQVQKLFIVDESKIPRSFLEPNRHSITAVLKEGGKVPGCELRYVDSISI